MGSKLEAGWNGIRKPNPIYPWGGRNSFWRGKRRLRVEDWAAWMAEEFKREDVKKSPADGLPRI